MGEAVIDGNAAGPDCESVFGGAGNGQRIKDWRCYLPYKKEVNNMY